jgi:AsmA protein
MKKVMIALGAIFALIIIAMISLMIFVNPNQFKPLIVEQSRDKAGIELHIDGDISWTFFPSFGLKLSQLRIDNPATSDTNVVFTDSPFIGVEHVETSINVLPLFSKSIVVEKVQIVGLSVRMQTLKSGESNVQLLLDSITKSSNTEEFLSDAAPKSNMLADEIIVKEALQEEQSPWDIEVVSIAFKDGFIGLDDQVNNQQGKVENLNILLSSFAFDEWADLTLDLDGDFNQQAFSLDAKTELLVDRNSKFSLRNLLVEGSFAGLAAAAERFSLSIDTFSSNNWAGLEVSANGAIGADKFDLQLSSNLLVNLDSSDFQLKQVLLEAKYQSEAIDIETFAINIDKFALQEWSKLEYALYATASENELSSQGQVTVKVNDSYEPIVETLISTSQISGPELDLDSLRVELSDWYLGSDSPLTIGMKGRLSGIDADVDFIANVRTDQELQVFAFDNLSLETNDFLIEGSTKINLAGENPAIRYNLYSPNIDVDALLAQTQQDSQSESATSRNLENVDESADPIDGQVVATEPDLTALQTIDIAGQFTIDKLKMNNAHLSNVQSDVAVANGVAIIKQLNADLYQGTAELTGYLDATKVIPTYGMTAKLNKVKVLPLLTDVADSDLIEGIGTMDASFTGFSLIPDNAMQNIQGQADVRFEDGAVNGVNIAHIIRTNYARLKGQKVPEDAIKKTDFTAMTATLNIAGGIVETDNLKAQSPLLRVDGAGEADYIAQTLDFLTKVSIVGSLEGQGGKGIEDLKDLTIPVRAKGIWADPQFSLDFSALKAQEVKRNQEKIEKKAKEEAERGLKKLLGDEANNEEVKKLSDKLLKSLFN